jgi:hypothetical protein
MEMLYSGRTDNPLDITQNTGEVEFVSNQTK